MSDNWQLVDNPTYAGVEPHPLKAACHDGSPCIDIRCGHCGYTLHQHESRTKNIPADAKVASRCFGCGRMLTFPPGWFGQAFQKMRDEGWIE